jgi:hypothetical protein
VKSEMSAAERRRQQAIKYAEVALQYARRAYDTLAELIAKIEREAQKPVAERTLPPQADLDAIKAAIQEARASIAATERSLRML